MADVEIAYDPITVNSGPLTVAVTGLNDVKVESRLAVTQPIETSLTLSVPEPVKTEGSITYRLPDPIRTESTSAIDLQPVVVDQCLRLSLGALPPTVVCLPNRQRIGLTLFGVEVFGLTLEGEARVVVGDLPKSPHVVHAPQVATHPGDHPHPAAPHETDASARREPPPFVIRLGR